MTQLIKTVPNNNTTTLSLKPPRCSSHTHTHAHTSVLWPSGLWDYPGEPVPESIWILLKLTVNVSGISWAICKLHVAPDR